MRRIMDKRQTRSPYWQTRKMKSSMTQTGSIPESKTREDLPKIGIELQTDGLITRERTLVLEVKGFR